MGLLPLRAQHDVITFVFINKCNLRLKEKKIMANGTKILGFEKSRKKKISR